MDRWFVARGDPWPSNSVSRRRPSAGLAEEDRQTWMRWAKSPEGTLTLEGPSLGRARFAFGIVGLLAFAATVSGAWVNLRPRAPSQAPQRRGRL